MHTNFSGTQAYNTVPEIRVPQLPPGLYLDAQSLAQSPARRPPPESQRLSPSKRFLPRPINQRSPPPVDHNAGLAYARHIPPLKLVPTIFKRDNPTVVDAAPNEGWQSRSQVAAPVKAGSSANSITLIPRRVEGRGEFPGQIYSSYSSTAGGKGARLRPGSRVQGLRSLYKVHSSGKRIASPGRNPKKSKLSQEVQ